MPIAVPIRGGTRVTITGDDSAQIPASAAETVAVGITHDWGPLNEPTLVSSPAEFDEVFGNSDTSGRRAVHGAFRGQGLQGIGGAGAVMVERMGVAGTAAKATVAISNTTPAAAITFTAKYHGDRGERISIVREAYAPDAAKNLVRVLFDGATVERYIYADTDITDLAAQVNANSALLTATVTVTGVALGAGTTALAAGNDGSTLTSTEYVAAIDTLDTAGFSILVFENLTDAGILATVKQWITDQYDGDTPKYLVTGGAAGETVGTALTRAAALDSPNILTVGVGTYRDDQVGEGEVNVSTAQLAPRIAGVLAARGFKASIMFARLAGVTPVADTGPTNDDHEDAIEGGVVTLSHSLSADADLKIESGVNTYQGNVDAEPREAFGDVRKVRVVHDYKRHMKLWGDETAIGALPVTDDTRQMVKGEAKRKAREYEEQSIIQAGTSTVDVSPPDDPSLAASIPYSFGWLFTETTKHIFANGKVR